jgi:hypothetical protein
MRRYHHRNGQYLRRNYARNSIDGNYAFVKDTHKWVKISAYKNLGPFIATLKGHIINDKLLESYIKMSTHEINDLSLEN